ANDLIVDIPKYVEQIGGDIQNITDDSFLESTYNKGYEWVQSTISDVPNAIKNYTGDLYDGFVNVATTVTNVFVALFTFPFVLFFLLKDGDAFKRFFIRILPPKFRSDANQILHNIDQQVGSYICCQIIFSIFLCFFFYFFLFILLNVGDAFMRFFIRILPPKLRSNANQILHNMDQQVGSYIRGQIIVAICIGILLYIGYLIIGLDFAITLAIIAAFTSVVPYI